MAAPAVVRMSVGSEQWSGVMIDESGMILTTSSGLGSSPLAQFRTPDGVTGEAWVIGRDDNLDIALLEVIDPIQTYPAVDVHNGAPPADRQNVGLLHYLANRVLPEQVPSSKVGSRRDTRTGIDYLQLSGFSTDAETGGAVIDADGVLRGLRMETDRMIELGIGGTGDVWAMDASILATAMIPRLQSGVTIINALAGGCENEGSVPPIPSLYKGAVTLNGTPMPTGERVYARVTRPGTDQSLWFSSRVSDAGEYSIVISICDPRFVNGTVDFWYHGERADGVTSVYQSATSRTNDLDF